MDKNLSSIDYLDHISDLNIKLEKINYLLQELMEKYATNEYRETPESWEWEYPKIMTSIDIALDYAQTEELERD